MPASLFARLDERVEGRFAENVMLRQVRDFDWVSSSAGPIEDWHDTIKYAARTMLLSGAPMAVLIGRDGLVAYNDAMRVVLGAHYDGAVGKPVSEIVPEATDFYRTAIEAAFEGRSSSFHDEPLGIYRNGSRESAWFDLAFTPVADESGIVHGVLLITSETTERVLAVRDLQRSRERLDLALHAGGIVGTWEVDFATDIVTADERYARLHGVDPNVARKGAGKEVFIAGIHPDDLGRVMAEFDRAKESGDYRYQHRVIGDDGIRWIISSGRMVMDRHARPFAFSGVVVDVTEQIETSAALAESELRFRTYTETLPQVVFSWDDKGRNDYYNQRWREFTGLLDGPIEPYKWQEFLHPDDRDRIVEVWRHALETAGRFDVETRLLHHSGEYRWGRVIALPTHDSSGRVAHWIGTLTDIHEAKLLETERELVARELDHRIKNIFAIVNGLVSLTSRDDHSVQSFADSLRGRLMALDQAHGFIKSGAGRAIAQQTGNSLQELVRRLLAPYAGRGEDDRLVIEGDDVQVDEGTATPLALIFHELATNAAKYGALSSDGGKIHLRSTKNGSMMRLVWVETSSQSVAAPGESSGFGSKLLALVIERQLQGRFSREIKPDGIRIWIELPLDSLTSSGT